MDTRTFLAQPTEFRMRHELVGGKVIPVSVQEHKDELIACFNVAMAVARREDGPFLWENPETSVSTRQVVCGNGNVRLAHAVVGLLADAGRADGEAGLIVQSSETLGAVELAAWLEDIKSAQQVRSVVVADFQNAEYVVAYRGLDRQWRQSSETDHGWSLNLARACGALRGSDFALAIGIDEHLVPTMTRF